MKTFRNLATWRLIIWSVLFIATVLFFGCGDDDDNDGLEQPLEEESTTTLNTPSVTQPPVDAAPQLDVVSFTIDATSREAWAYFSLAKDDVVEVADPLNSMDWDLGFQRTKVKLNGGISGPGQGAAVTLKEVEFDPVKEAPADGYVADSDQNLGIVAQSEEGWYIYTGPPNHWILPLEKRVFVVQAADGTFAKVRFIGYYKDNDNKKEGGFVTFEYVHQPDGSRNF